MLHGCVDIAPLPRVTNGRPSSRQLLADVPDVDRRVRALLSRIAMADIVTDVDDTLVSATRRRAASAR